MYLCFYCGSFFYGSPFGLVLPTTLHGITFFFGSRHCICLASSCCTFWFGSIPVAVVPSCWFVGLVGQDHRSTYLHSSFQLSLTLSYMLYTYTYMPLPSLQYNICNACVSNTYPMMPLPANTHARSIVFYTCHTHAHHACHHLPFWMPACSSLPAFFCPHPTFCVCACLPPACPASAFPPAHLCLPYLALPSATPMPSCLYLVPSYALGPSSTPSCLPSLGSWVVPCRHGRAWMVDDGGRGSENGLNDGSRRARTGSLPKA